MFTRLFNVFTLIFLILANLSACKQQEFHLKYLIEVARHGARAPYYNNIDAACRTAETLRC